MSNYTGDPTATQAPAPPPTPGAAAIGDLPDDGDAADAASVRQALKVPLDYLAWIFSPRSVVAAWAQALRVYKDARLRARFVIDHFGMPGGEILQWREHWGKTTDWLFTAGTSGSVLGTSGQTWDINQTSAAGIVGVNPPGISAGVNFSDTHPVISLSMPNAGVEIAEMLLNDACPTACWSTNMLASLDYNLQQHVVTDTTWVHGVCGSGEHVNTIANGAFFIRANSPGATWHARTIAASVQTDVDTGIAGTADATHHYKIVMVGSAIDDSSTTRALFFIDGALVANITSNIPAVGSKIYPVFGGFTSGAGGNQSMLVGPPHWVQATRFQTP